MFMIIKKIFFFSYCLGLTSYRRGTIFGYC